MRTVLFKVGGSLFDLRDLGPRLEQVLRFIDAEQSLLFPGGGATADVVRKWHDYFQFSEEQSHALAVESLDLNARLLTELVPTARRANDDEMDTFDHPGTIVIWPTWACWDTGYSRLDDAPPHVWDVTSDTLAAWTAIRWPADELVMLKSVPCPTGCTATGAVQRGLVDAYFPGYAGRLPRVSWCCLRNAEPRVVPWLEYGECVGKESAP